MDRLLDTEIPHIHRLLDDDRLKHPHLQQLDLLDRAVKSHHFYFSRKPEIVDCAGSSDSAVLIGRNEQADLRITVQHILCQFICFLIRGVAVDDRPDLMRSLPQSVTDPIAPLHCSGRAFHMGNDPDLSLPVYKCRRVFSQFFSRAVIVRSDLRNRNIPVDHRIQEDQRDSRIHDFLQHIRNFGIISRSDKKRIRFLFHALTDDLDLLFHIFLSAGSHHFNFCPHLLSSQFCTVDQGCPKPVCRIDRLGDKDQMIRFRLIPIIPRQPHTETDNRKCQRHSH